jgi:hypothetical protein
MLWRQLKGCMPGMVGVPKGPITDFMHDWMTIQIQLQRAIGNDSWGLTLPDENEPQRRVGDQ